MINLDERQKEIYSSLIERFDRVKDLEPSLRQREYSALLDESIRVLSPKTIMAILAYYHGRP